MTDKKLTDKEIIKALEGAILLSHERVMIKTFIS